MIAPLYAAIATGAFSLLFGLHSLDLALASAGAAIGWAVFQSIPALQSPAFAAFFAALAVGLYGEIVAHFRSRPATTYTISAIIPIVPGGGMYYTMLSTLEGDSSRTVQLALSTLMTAFALAAGLAVSGAFGTSIAAVLAKKRREARRPF